MIGAEGFSRERHVWLRAVMGCHDLPAAAKNAGYALVMEFANRETGRCNPSMGVVAEFLGVTDRHLRGLVAALEKAGFLRVFRGVGRGRASFYRFVVPASAAHGGAGGGGRVVQFRPRPEATEIGRIGDPDAARDRPARRATAGPENRKSCVVKPERSFTPLKRTMEKPNARASGEGVLRASAEPLQGPEVIVREADGWPLECWRRWLRDQGLPDLRREADDGWIAEKQGWAMPSRYPPAAADAEGTGRAKAVFGGRAARAGSTERARDRGAAQSIVQGFAGAARAPSAAVGGRGHG